MENLTLKGLRQMAEMRSKTLSSDELYILRIEEELDKRQYDYDQLEDIIVALLALLMRGEMVDAIRLSKMLSEPNGIVQFFNFMGE
jgi:hypothetical protein